MHRFGRSDVRAQADRVAAWRVTELSAVLAAELGGALVADMTADPGDVGGIRGEQQSGALQADLLLVTGWGSSR